MVLVWGPGEPADEISVDSAVTYWQKRNQIKEQLRKTFPKAEVFFSEDQELRNRTRSMEDPLVEEMVHALAADCILILDVSRGAHVEVDQFAANPRIADKIRLLIPDKWVGTKGLVGVLHQRVRVFGFSHDEFQFCKLATEKSVHIVLSVAIRKLFYQGSAPLLDY